jgi:hypothetical protein
VVRTCTVRLTGKAATGTRVDGALLRDLLDTLVDAVAQSVRMRVEGRSKAAGPAPTWLEKAAAFTVEIQAGSTQLVLEAPALAEIAPDRFAQQELFEPMDADASCLDVLAEALDDALAAKPDSDLYDDGLVETLESFGSALRHDVEQIEWLNGRSRRLDRAGVDGLRQLRRQIPREQRVRLAGRLDLLRHSNRMFELILAEGERIRGAVAADVDFAPLGGWLGEHVVASGTARFRPSGRVLRLEAEQVVRAEGDQSVLSKAPVPVLATLDVRSLRVAQGPKSGVSAIFGTWPGNETDDQVLKALRDLS